MPTLKGLMGTYAHLTYYRALNTRESGIEGTGKGLSMIKKMVSGLTIKSPVTDNKEFPGTEIIVLLN